VTTAIRTWADSDFYLSSAGTTNVREQIIKLQSIGKLVRALSDASTVDTNGDKLQDRLLGLSLGDLTQRHKYRVLYDNLNDRFLVQRNSGTDSSKVWVELLRIDNAGNVTTTGSLSTDALTTTAGGVTLGGTLDANDYYLRNLDKNVGEFRTDSLRVHGASTLRATTATTLSLSSTLSVTGATTLGTLSAGASTFASGITLQNSHSPGLVYIQSMTASNSSAISFGDLDDYDVYEVHLIEVSPATDAVDLVLRFSLNNGLSYEITGYDWAGSLQTTFPGRADLAGSGDNRWNLVGAQSSFRLSNSAALKASGVFRLHTRGDASNSRAKFRSHLDFTGDSGFFTSCTMAGRTSVAGAVNAFQFLMSSGNIATGTFRLYGYRNS
jgi:hypothetical protein